MKAGSASTLCAIALAAIASPTIARADEVADFYRGKDVILMNSGSPGASLALYHRPVAQMIGKHIPGNPTVRIEQRGGGGGTRGAAYMYNVAPRDGTYFAILLSSVVVSPKLRDMKWDSAKFSWVGSVSPRPSVVSLWHTAAAKSVDDAKRMEVILGTTNTGAETYTIPALMNALLGTKFKIVKGYGGGDALTLAIERGEVQGRQQYWSSWTGLRPDWLKENKLVHIAQYGPRIPELPGVPSLYDLAPTPEGKQMVRFLELAADVGLAFAGPPEVPADRLAALRQAFMATMKDPEFLAEGKRLRLDIDPIPGEKLQQIVERGYNIPDGLAARLKTILGSD